jgi:chitin synthase
MRRKKSLVRPDRAPIDPSHRLYNYRNHAAAMEADERGRVEVSDTGATAIDGSAALAPQPYEPNASPLEGQSPSSNLAASPNSGPSRAGLMAALGRQAPPSGYSGLGSGPGARSAGTGGLRRGQSILARRPGEAEESGLAILKRGETLRRTGKHRKSRSNVVEAVNVPCLHYLSHPSHRTNFLFFCVPAFTT